MLNGLPALVVDLGEGLPREARRVVIRAEVDAEGLIRRPRTVLASRKLAALRP